MARVRHDTQNLTAKEKLLWHIGIYIRLSREDGEDESLSIGNQRKIILEYIKASFEEEHTIVDFFIDDGVTGTNHDRPEFQRMLRDIEAKRINCVLCKNLSRAFRNYADQGFFLESFFPKHQTRFISIASPTLDSYKNPEALSGLEVPITGLMNDRFAGKTSEDVRRTFDMKRRNGEFIGAFAPYGYRKDPNDKNKLVPDPEAANIVRDIYSLYVKDGLSIQGIVRTLNSRGIPNPSAYKRKQGLAYQNPNAIDNDNLWNATTLRRMLQNELYLGHMVQGKQKTINYKVHNRISTPKAAWFIRENTHEPIISPALFNSAQEILHKDIRAASSLSPPHILSGFIRCADCGKALCRHPARGIVYYLCRTYSQKARDQCTRHSIRGDILEETLLTVFRSQITLENRYAKATGCHPITPCISESKKRLETLIHGKIRESEKLRRAFTCLYVDWKDNEISRDEYMRLQEDLNQQMERMQSAIAHLEAEFIDNQESRAIDASSLDSILESGCVERLHRDLLAALLSEVRVHEEKRIVILCKQADPYLAYAQYQQNRQV